MEILPFQSDYHELSQIIKKAWPLEHEGHIDFTADYLQSLVLSPDTEKDLTLGAYHKGKLISFLLSKKKRLTIHGCEYKALLNTLGSTDPEYAYLFPYVKLKEHSIRNGLERDYRLNFGFMAWGINNNVIERLFAEKMKFHCHRVNSFGWFGLPLEEYQGAGELGLDSSIQIRSFTPQDGKQCLALIEAAINPCAIYQRWEMATFISRMRQTVFNGAKVVLVNGDLAGFVGYTQLDLSYKTLKRKICFLYHLFLDILPDRSKKMIIDSIAHEMKDGGVQGISIPNTGYFSPGFLKEMGFKELPFKKLKTNLYMTVFDETIPFTDQESFYLEIQ